MTPRSLVQQGIGAGPIEELVISSLLWVHESTVHADLVRVSPKGGRAATRVAVNFIESHLADPLTLKDIARATNLSARAIQQAFHDDLSTTPMHYVRDRRLERARDQLADAVPADGITVTDVAERWGFGHLGNFSAAYRKRFGESPSQTLRR
jgi:AraC-like DNA-binding protein